MTNAVRLSVDDRVRSALAQGAVVAFSLSGGKDSGAASHAASEWLDKIGHPRADRVAIHADLGRAEWRSTPPLVEATAGRLGLPLMVVRHRKHDMVSRWEARFAEGKRRYAQLEIFNLIGPWSSASLRFCTAELKQQVIAPALQRRFPGRTIISVVGIRREESLNRRLAPISKPEHRWDRRDGTHLLTWHPVLQWSAAEVFEHHRLHGLPLHEAYRVYGSSRVSCAFCVMQSAADQAAAARAADNGDLLNSLVDLEARSTFSFQPGRWLADVAPALLAPSLLAAVAVAKGRSLQRRGLECVLPKDLRYVAGWPLRAPSLAEAETIVEVRRTILGHHELSEVFATPADVIGRFEQLLVEKAERRLLEGLSA